MATHPAAKIRCCASNIVLNVHSAALYLSAPHLRSPAGGYFFLGSTPCDGSPIQINGAVHVTCTILKLVVASMAEAELGALFLNAQEAKVNRLVLKELGHLQPLTPIHVDTTTVGIVNNTIKQLRSGTMKMRYFWLLVMVKHNNSFDSIINPAKRTWVTTLPNITQLTFINMFTHIMFTCTTLQHFFLKLQSLVLGKGALKL
jgi:hypothetical protein